jgi:dolichyl-diphosphooligosaccharide--protein glycosyltransferase
LFLAAALDVALRHLVWRDAWAWSARAGATAIFAAVVGWALWPSVASYGLDLGNLQRAARGESLRLSEAKRITLLKTSAAHWLRRLSPDTAGFLDRTLQPEYGVLTSRSDGHVFLYSGRRPVVQGVIGEASSELVDRYYSSTNETEAVSILRELGVRYVVASAGEDRRLDDYGPRSMFAHLGLVPGRLEGVAGSGSTEREVPATYLAHHRLIYETPQLAGLTGEVRSYYKLYEVVPGARVEGSAPPGTRVEARLRLLAEPDGELLFRAVSVADASGRFALTVPYPTEPFSDFMRSADSYELVSPLGGASFRVSEAAVRGGDVVEGPPLRR